MCPRHLSGASGLLAVISGAFAAGLAPAVAVSARGAGSVDNRPVPRRARLMATADPAATTHPHLVEDRRRLSRSLVWQLQRAFYERRGALAWTAGRVPWFVSSNACLARAYAQVIDAHLRDVAAGAHGPEHAASTVQIVEVGAGPGRFAFLVLEQLLALDALRAGLGPRAPFRYIVTDLSEANLAFCATHPALRPHLDAGRLDLARFDAERDTELHLRRSGDVLAPAPAGGPMIVVANYAFDTFTHDAFRVEGGALHESLPAVYSTAAEPTLDEPDLLERLRLVYERVAIDDAYSGDPALDTILAGYRRTLTDTTVCVPIGALTCLRALHQLAGGRLLLLAADKGFVVEDELLHRDDPQPVLHGSFSLSVNFHALASWFRHHGGHAFDVTQRDGTIAITGFVAGAVPAAVARTRAAFADWIETFGPADFFQLQVDQRGADKPPGLGSLLAMLRLADWDPWLFYQLADRLRRQLDDASDAVRRDTRRALTRVWARYYHLGGDQDVPFEIARILQRLRHHTEAIAFYRRSIELFGASHVTHHNMGLCHHYGLQHHADALAEFERALALDPDYGPARAWKLRAEAELRGA